MNQGEYRLRQLASSSKIDSLFAHVGLFMRRGIAQLEFVLVLVVLIPLFLALLWLGFAGSTYTMVISDARHQAWRARQVMKSKPFDFDESAQGRIEKTRLERIHFIAMFDSWANPQSKHIVYAGSWGHPQIDLNKNYPNYELMSDLALKAPKDRAANIKEFVGNMQKFFNVDYSTIHSEAIRKALPIQSFVDRMDREKSALDSTTARDLSSARKEANRVATERIKDIEGKLVSLGEKKVKLNGLEPKIGDLPFSKFRLDKLTADVLKDEKKLQELFGDSAEGKKIFEKARLLSADDVKYMKELQKTAATLSAVRTKIADAEALLKQNKGSLEKGLTPN
jgi:hypothetical protein